MANINKERMKIYVLDNGTLRMDRNLMIANSNQATIDSPNPPNELIKFPICTVFIDRPEAKILFDTACNQEGMAGEDHEGRWGPNTLKAFPTLPLKNADYRTDWNRLVSILKKSIMLLLPTSTLTTQDISNISPTQSSSYMMMN